MYEEPPPQQLTITALNLPVSNYFWKVIYFKLVTTINISVQTQSVNF